MVMYPAHVTPEAWREHPVGTGAQQFSDTRQDVNIQLVRNPNYFRKDGEGRTLPYLDAMTYTHIGDNSLALAAFRSGRIHCGCTFDRPWMSPNEAQLRREIPGVKLDHYGGTSQFLTINITREPFSNKAFREAVFIGLDKETVAVATWEDRQVWPWPPMMMSPASGGALGLPKDEMHKLPGFNKDHSKDVALAMQKFRESGIDPKSVRLELISSRSTQATSEAVAGVLRTDLGLEVSVDIIAGVADKEVRQRNGEFDLNTETRGHTLDDPSEWFAQYVASDGARNVVGYANPRIDELLRMADLELDTDKRRPMVWEMQKLALADAVVIPLMGPLGTGGARPEVFGYTAGPTTHSNMRFDLFFIDERFS